MKNKGYSRELEDRIYNDEEEFEYISKAMFGLNKYVYTFKTKEDYDKAYKILESQGNIIETFVNNAYGFEFWEYKDFSIQDEENIENEEYTTTNRKVLFNFSKDNIREMYSYIHQKGNNIYDGLAYLYSICTTDEELNKYIMSKINYDTNNNSLNSEKLYAMQIIARNNFENKYKELLGEYTMFTVDKDSLELEEKTIQKYPQLNYDKEAKTFELEVDEDKIDNFFITYRCYPKNVIKQLENRLFNEYGIPVTIGDENIEQIQKEMGELGVSIYQKYYDWYKENGLYEHTEYIDSFCYGKIEEIKDYLDEVIDFTENSDEISKEDKVGIINQAKEFKNKLDEYERTKEEEVEINE